MMDSLTHNQKLILEEKSKLWNVFDILRKEGIMPEDYYVVLLFLSLYKDEILSEDLLTADKLKRDEFETVLLKQDSEERYKRIYNAFKTTLQTLSSEGLISVINRLRSLEHSIVKENFAELFDSVLYDLTMSQGKYGGESIQPREITRLIHALSQLPDDAQIFNPFAGLSSFSTNIQKEQFYFGQELNPKTWAIGALRVMAYGKTDCSKYVCEDSILNWPEATQKFDLIVSHPPFGLSIKQYGEMYNEFKRLEHFLLEKGLHSLKNEGKLIALLPEGFLFKKGKEEQLRKRLIDEDILETIISFPGGVLFNTGLPFIILVVNKKKDRPGKVQLIKADTFLETKDKRVKVLDDRKLVSYLRQSTNYELKKAEQDTYTSIVNEPIAVYGSVKKAQNVVGESEIIRVVDIREIEQKGYSLTVPKYFQSEIQLKENEKLVKLKDVLTLLNENNKRIPENGILLDITDLKEDKLNFRLNVSELKNTDLDKAGLCKIETSCLLMAARAPKLKPTYFDYEGIPIYTNLNILSFKVNASLADTTYLIHELHSDYVNEQLKAFRSGTIIPHISKTDLLNIAIRLPSLEEQRAKVKGILEISNEIKLLQAKLESITVKESETKYEKNASLKHRLGGPLLSLGSSVRNIERVLDKQFEDWRDVKLSERHEVSLHDTFKSIYQTLEMVHNILAISENEIDFSNKTLEELDLVDFLNNYVKRVKSAEKSNVSVRLDIHDDIKSELKNKAVILGNQELLNIALNTIVENAYKHAFIDDSKNYKLEFSIGLQDASGLSVEETSALSDFKTFIKIEVANNGKAFPENFSLDKLIMKNRFAGNTGNTGQGGFDLNEIIKFHNKGVSTLDLLKGDGLSEFSTTYSFLIPHN